MIMQHHFSLSKFQFFNFIVLCHKTLLNFIINTSNELFVEKHLIKIGLNNTHSNPVLFYV